MGSDKNYYELLGVSPDATSSEIREAYIYKVNILHPDRLGGASERIRKKAEEEFKLVNEANEILSDPKKRRAYDNKIFGSGIAKPAKNGDVEIVPKSEKYSTARLKKAPKPEIHPKKLRLQNGLSYVKQRGSFFIRNVGGPFSKVKISNPPGWITDIKTVPLEQDRKLPMRVDVEVMGIQWGKKYSSDIIVRLDNAEAKVKIELQMEAKPRNFDNFRI